MGASVSDEWDLDSLINASDHICGYCGKDIHTVEEIKLLQVVYATGHQHAVNFLAVSDERGEFQYTPYFFHFMCWEEITESLEEFLDEREPVFDAAGQGTCECTGCTADIRSWETMGLVSFGELRRSNLMPNGESTFYFDECNTKPHTLCISCLKLINDEILEMWKGLNHNGECAQGTQARCWRDGRCRFGCRRLCAPTPFVPGELQP